MSVEPSEAEVRAYEWRSREVNTGSFQQGCVFIRQFGRHIFSPELIVPSIFLVVEELLPRIANGEGRARGDRFPRLRPFEDFYFFQETGAATTACPARYTASVERLEA